MAIRFHQLDGKTEICSPSRPAFTNVVTSKPGGSGPITLKPNTLHVVTTATSAD